jgi:hypothetical protein
MMPDLGTIRRDGDSLHILLPERFGGCGLPSLRALWLEVKPRNEALYEALRALETGTVIDHRVLLEKGEVVVVRYAETKITDAGLERLLDAAEMLEGGRQ